MWLRRDMTSTFRNVGLVSRLDRKKALDLSAKLFDYLQSKGLQVFPESELARRINREEQATPLERMKADFIVIVGGDGTILRACLSIPKPEPPILAINMGVRGFLAEVQPKDALKAVDKCIDGRFTLESHAKIASSINGKRLPDALNEVFVTADAPVKILHVRIWKNDVPIGWCRADGIMVASQVGSTGYSLSAGGPVLDPETNAFVLTPVCPLTIFHPIVFSTKVSVKIQIVKPERILIVVDGHYHHLVESKRPRLTVTRSENETSFIRFGDGFYQRLKGRLLFSKGGKA